MPARSSVASSPRSTLSVEEQAAAAPFASWQGSWIGARRRRSEMGDGS